MKILQVIYSLTIGGAEKLIVDIAPLLREKGHEVDILLINGEDSHFRKALLDKGFKIISLGNKRHPYNPKSLFGITKVMNNYDIIHTHLTSPQLFVALGSLFCHKPVLVTTEHNATNRRRDHRFYRFFDKWMYKRYKKIICISDSTNANLQAYLPELENLCTIYNGVDVNSFRNAKPIDTLRDNKKIIVTMVAAFRPQKDHKTLIDAMALLPEDKYELWIVGDGEAHNEVHNYAKKISNIKFFGNRPDVPEILHTSDIIVMSSHYEGLSLSSIEGMSIGKPFVASDVDGLHEMVVDAGVLVPHLDAKALANEIEHLANDEFYYKKIANRCWEKAKSFDITEMVNKYEEIYKSLIQDV